MEMHFQPYHHQSPSLTQLPLHYRNSRASFNNRQREDGKGPFLALFNMNKFQKCFHALQGTSTSYYYNHCNRNKYQFSPVAQSCPTLCDPINCSTPGFPVHHQLPESTQTHVHRVGDAIQPYHPLSSPSPPALNLSQHQGLFR